MLCVSIFRTFICTSQNGGMKFSWATMGIRVFSNSFCFCRRPWNKYKCECFVLTQPELRKCHCFIVKNNFLVKAQWLLSTQLQKKTVQPQGRGNFYSRFKCDWNGSQASFQGWPHWGKKDLGTVWKGTFSSLCALSLHLQYFNEFLYEAEPKPWWALAFSLNTSNALQSKGSSATAARPVSDIAGYTDYLCTGSTFLLCQWFL